MLSSYSLAAVTHSMPWTLYNLNLHYLNVHNLLTIEHIEMPQHVMKKKATYLLEGVEGKQAGDEHKNAGGKQGKRHNKNTEN